MFFFQLFWWNDTIMRAQPRYFENSHTNWRNTLFMRKSWALYIILCVDFQNNEVELTSLYHFIKKVENTIFLTNFVQKRPTWFGRLIYIFKEFHKNPIYLWKHYVNNKTVHSKQNLSNDVQMTSQSWRFSKVKDSFDKKYVETEVYSCLEIPTKLSFFPHFVTK